MCYAEHKDRSEEVIMVRRLISLLLCLAVLLGTAGCALDALPAAPSPEASVPDVVDLRWYIN